MLRRERRIHTARDHQRVWRRGRVLRGAFVIVRVAPAATEASRFGFVVSTSVAKKATDRNKIKRRLRAITQKAAPPLPVDAVVYATKRAATAQYKELQADLLSLLPHNATHTYRPH